jgi:hypothetical protein
MIGEAYLEWLRVLARGEGYYKRAALSVGFCGNFIALPLVCDEEDRLAAVRDW